MIGAHAIGSHALAQLIGYDEAAAPDITTAATFAPTAVGPRSRLACLAIEKRKPGLARTGRFPLRQDLQPWHGPVHAAQW